jgi:hypothetical protein
MKTSFTKMLGVCCGLLAIFSFASVDANAQCAAVPGPGVDVNDPCYASTIASDPFCCDNTWDTLCNDNYTACTGGGGGDCAAVPGPGVDVNDPCYASTIAADSFCCDTEWDTVCNDAYTACIGGGGGDCPAGQIADCNGNCAPAVWVADGLCDDGTFSFNGIPIFFNCPEFGNDGGDCDGVVVCVTTPDACVLVGSPAYNDVIAADAFCCDNTWDSTCQDAYDALSSSCTSPTCAETPACVDTAGAAYATVIAGDPFCCDNSWDLTCQAAYDALSGSCEPVPCAETPACVDLAGAAYATVIAADAFCCDNTWDTLCQSEYDLLSGTCDDTVPCVTTPDACVVIGSLAYNDVIAADAFCCDNTWDLTCQAAYDALSGSCEPVPCAETPACVDLAGAAYATVIAADSFCCDNSWDLVCQSAYDALSDSCLGCQADGGTLTAPANRSFCVGTGSQQGISVTAVGAVGTNQRWGLIDALGNVVDTRGNNSNFNLDLVAPGDYSIRYIRFEDDVTNLNTITNVSQVNTLVGCFDVASNAINIFLRSEPNGGILTALSPTTVCANSGASTGIAVSVAGNVGENFRFGLTSQALGNQVIATNTSGTFNLNGQPAGTYSVAHISFQEGVSIAGVQFPSDLDGCFDLSNLITVTVVDCATVTLESSPNPTAGQSFVTFTNSVEEYATLEVYDMSGRMVQRLFNQVTAPGQEYRLEFNGDNLPNGVYLYRLTTDTNVIVDKFMIAR